MISLRESPRGRGLALRPKGGDSRSSRADATPPEVGLSGLVAAVHYCPVLATFPLMYDQRF
jgi:hypothetical protein